MVLRAKPGSGRDRRSADRVESFLRHQEHPHHAEPERDDPQVMNDPADHFLIGTEVDGNRLGRQVQDSSWQASLPTSLKRSSHS